MLNKTYIQNGVAVYEEAYTSLSEYVNQVDSYELSRMCRDTNITSDEAKRLAILGNEIDFQKIQAEIDKTKLSDTELFLKQRRHDVVGSRPLAQKALNGSPNCYVRRKKQLVKQRIVNLYIDIGTPWYVWGAERTKKFTEILILAKSLELANYRVGITIFKNHYYSKSNAYSMYAIQIKKPEELMNIKKYSWCLGNSLFGRTFCFANEISKHQKPNRLDEGLGLSYAIMLSKLKTYKEYVDKISGIVNEFVERTSGTNTNALYVSYYTDLEELKKKITQ